MVHQTVTLTSDAGYGSRVPAEEIGLALSSIVPAVRMSILMAVQGRSTSKGRRLEWLKRASDIRFVRLSGKKETVLHFEAPTLGESFPELYKQEELWPSKPSENTTGFDTLAKTISEVSKGLQDSDLYDRRLLDDIKKFDHVLNGTFSEISIGDGQPESRKAVINHNTVKTATELRAATPEPRQVRLVGRLDMIRYSTRGLELMLDDGEKARGILVEGQMDSLRDLLNQRVLVEGKAVYRPSARLLRIEVATASIGEGAPNLWSKIPEPIARKLDRSSLRKRQTPQSGVNAFFGTWPGDETEDELLEIVEEIRS